jgi:putative sigma-54 modulation protein
MDIRVQSVKFDADDKLLAFVNKKVEKLSKFFDGFLKADVTLSLLPDNLNKEVKIRLQVPGDDIYVTRNAKSFEDAVDGLHRCFKRAAGKDEGKEIRQVKVNMFAEVAHAMMRFRRSS